MTSLLNVIIVVIDYTVLLLFTTFNDQFIKRNSYLVTWYNRVTNVSKSAANTNNAVKEWGVLTFSD